MSDKPTSSFTLGFEKEARVFRCAQISFQKGRAVIEKLIEKTLPVDNAEEAHLSSLREWMASFPKKYLSVSVLSPGETIVRPLELKLKKLTDINAVLSFEA